MAKRRMATNKGDSKMILALNPHGAETEGITNGRSFRSVALSAPPHRSLHSPILARPEQKMHTKKKWGSLWGNLIIQILTFIENQ